MLKFRMEIINGILNSSDYTLVEKVIYEIIKQKTENGISLKRIKHALPSLESDVLFQIRLKRNQKELKNLIEALRILREGITIDYE